MIKLIKRRTTLATPHAREARYFIIGTQKSGTTWLRDCLGEVVPMINAEPYYPELHDKIARHLRTYTGKLLGSAVDDVARDAAVAAYDVVMKGFAGDKSAYPCSDAIGNVREDLHPFAVRLVKQHFPDARVIVIVRDPRSVFVSLQHYLDYFRPGWSKEIDPDRFGATWMSQNHQWLADKPHSIVKYEDLKLHFRSTLSKVFSEISLHVDARKIKDIEIKAYDIEKYRSNQPEIFRNGYIDEWRQNLHHDIIERIESSARPIMASLGYLDKGVQDQTCDI